MEKMLIEAIQGAVPGVDVYHDYASEESAMPLLILQRVGGAGPLFLDHQTPGGYQVRFSVIAWAADRLHAVALSQQVEAALLDLPGVAAVSAADALADTETGNRGMVQDFWVTA